MKVPRSRRVQKAQKGGTAALEQSGGTINWLEVDDQNNLPSTGDQNTLYMVKNTGHLWKYDNTWIDLGHFDMNPGALVVGGAISTASVGPQGPQGPKGQQDSTGPNGPKGQTGEIGYTGVTGDTGTDGYSGIKGPTGPYGPVGDQGISDTGPTGPQGPSGVLGPFGYGLTGNTGDPGIKGLKGDTGYTGPTGPVGTYIVGPDGQPGATGAIGPKGIVGIVGLSNTGPTGYVGPTGYAGQVGATGSEGPAGLVGYQGLPGPKGMPGGVSHGLTFLGQVDPTQTYTPGNMLLYNNSLYLVTKNSTGNTNVPSFATPVKRGTFGTSLDSFLLKYLFEPASSVYRPPNVVPAIDYSPTDLYTPGMFVKYNGTLYQVYRPNYTTYSPFTARHVPSKMLNYIGCMIASDKTIAEYIEDCKNVSGILVEPTPNSQPAWYIGKNLVGMPITGVGIQPNTIITSVESQPIFDGVNQDPNISCTAIMLSKPVDIIKVPRQYVSFYSSELTIDQMDTYNIGPPAYAIAPNILDWAAPQGQPFNGNVPTFVLPTTTTTSTTTSTTTTTTTLPPTTTIPTQYFSDGSIPGLMTWYDASDPLGTNTLNSSGYTLIYQGGQQISAWIDKSKSKYNATNVPYYNTIAVETDGGGNYLSFSGNSNTVPTFLGIGGSSGVGLDWMFGSYFTLFVVENVKKITGNNSVLASSYQIGPFTGFGFGYSNASQVYWNMGGNYVSANFSTPLPTGVTRLWTLAFNSPGTLNIYLNGSVVGSATIPQGFLQNHSITTIGWEGSRSNINSSYAGGIREILGFKGDLSQANQQTAEGYLAWKWGLYNTLPTNHTWSKTTPYPKTTMYTTTTTTSTTTTTTLPTTTTTTTLRPPPSWFNGPNGGGNWYVGPSSGNTYASYSAYNAAIACTNDPTCYHIFMSPWNNWKYTLGGNGGGGQITALDSQYRLSYDINRGAIPPGTNIPTPDPNNIQ